jgi:hypothetical protein
LEETTLKNVMNVAAADVAIKKSKKTPAQYYNELKPLDSKQTLKVFYHDKQNTYS